MCVLCMLGGVWYVMCGVCCGCVCVYDDMNMHVGVCVRVCACMCVGWRMV